MIWIFATIVTVVLMLGLGIGAAIDSVFFGIVIALGISVLGVKVFLKSSGKKDDKPSEVGIEFDKETGTARLYKRIGSNLSGMKIRQYKKTYTKYNPSKTVFTAATVGGITTGGFHQTQAYLSDTYAGGSDAYYLEVKSLSWEADRLYDVIILKKIILTDELSAEAAKDSRVSKFLHGNELILKKSGKDSELTLLEKDILRQAVLSGDVATQENITQRAFLTTQLSWKECLDIKDWISGDIPNTEAQLSDGDTHKRKHPSHCIHRDKKTHCNCRLSKKYHKACSSTSGCRFYKERKS